MKIKYLAPFLSLVFLSGCSSAGLFLLNSSLKLTSTHTVTRDIQYGPEAWQQLDLHLPSSQDKQKKPVLIFFYGGSWDSGNKEMYYFVANSFAKRGYLVVIPDYAKYPKVRFPIFVQDGATAIDWVLDNIHQHGGDESQVVIAGHSAGAHLGALLLSDEKYLAEHDRTAKDVRAFAGLAGPYNFTPTSNKLLDVFSPAGDMANMQVNTFVNGGEPEMLLLHGETDTTVGVQNLQSLEKQLQSNSVPVSAKIYPKMGHVKILMTLTPPLTSSTSTLADMDQFFKRVLSDDQPTDDFISRDSDDGF